MPTKILTILALVLPLLFFLCSCAVLSINIAQISQNINCAILSMSQCATTVNDDDDCSLEELRAAKIKRNQEMLASLKIPKLVDKSKRRRLPVMTSKVIRDCSVPREQPTRIVTNPTIVVSSDDLSLRTPSRAGKWSCVVGCTETFDAVPEIVKHLQAVHKLPMLQSI